VQLLSRFRPNKRRKSQKYLSKLRPTLKSLDINSHPSSKHSPKCPRARTSRIAKCSRRWRTSSTHSEETSKKPCRRPTPMRTLSNVTTKSISNNLMRKRKSSVNNTLRPTKSVKRREVGTSLHSSSHQWHTSFHRYPRARSCCLWGPSQNRKQQLRLESKDSWWLSGKIYTIYLKADINEELSVLEKVLDTIQTPPFQDFLAGKMANWWTTLQT